MDGSRAASAGSGSGVSFDPSVFSLHVAESEAQTTPERPDLFIARPLYKLTAGCCEQHVRWLYAQLSSSHRHSLDSPLHLHQILPLVMSFPQTDVMHQSVYELVHTEDQQELRRNLHWALNPPPVAAPAITQDSPQGDHRLPRHQPVIKTAAQQGGPGGPGCSLLH